MVNVSKLLTFIIFPDDTDMFCSNNDFANIIVSWCVMN